MDLSNQRFVNQDWSGQDLRNVPMNNSEFLCCKFDRCNLSGNDCSHSSFTGSSLVETLCRNTNFAQSRLGCTFKPKDAYGMTLTLNCLTFRGMNTSSFWWYCWQQFSLLMTPEKEKDGTDPKQSLIASLGISKYLSLQRMFKEREL